MLIPQIEVQVTDAINEYVQKKVGHAVDPYKTVVQDIDVRLSVRGGDASRGERCAHAECLSRCTCRMAAFMAL